MDGRMLVDAAVAALVGDFSDVTVYEEIVEQGFSRPCFFVSAEEREEALLNDRAARSFQLNVLYHGEGRPPDRAAASDMAAALAVTLEWLDVDGLPRRIQAGGWECGEDGTLHWKGEYRGHVFKRIPQVKMKTLEKGIRTR